MDSLCCLDGCLQCDVTPVLPAENLILDSGSVMTASPALNHCHLHGELSGRTSKDDMADDMWALGVIFHDMITSTSPSGKSAFEATKSAIQAVQAEWPDDSYSDQKRRACLNEQIKWVSRAVQKHKVYLLMHPFYGAAASCSAMQCAARANIAELLMVWHFGFLCLA